MFKVSFRNIVCSLVASYIICMPMIIFCAIRNPWDNIMSVQNPARYIHEPHKIREVFENIPEVTGTTSFSPCAYNYTEHH